jgi:hypothetical protein
MTDVRDFLILFYYILILQHSCEKREYKNTSAKKPHKTKKKKFREKVKKSAHKLEHN